MIANKENLSLFCV